MKDSLSGSKIYPLRIRRLRAKYNSALCVQCGKWIHRSRAGLKTTTPELSRDFACSMCEGDNRELVEQEEKLCDEVETVRVSTYLGERVNAGGGCEAAVTARTKF